MYSSDMLLKSRYAAPSWVHAVTSSSLVYGVDDDRGDRVIDIYNLQHEWTKRLTLPPGRKWSLNLSVVVVRDSGNVMVADTSNTWLDVFSAAGTIIIHTH